VSGEMRRTSGHFWGSFFDDDRRNRPPPIGRPRPLNDGPFCRGRLIAALRARPGIAFTGEEPGIVLEARVRGQFEARGPPASS
jgi:hypothetical protein